MIDSPSLAVMLLIAAVFALGGFVKGVVGLGLPTVAMGLLSVLMLPAQAAALLVVPSLVTNLWQIGGRGLLALLRHLAPLLLGIGVGVAAGTAWLPAVGGGSGHAPWATLGLGLALIVYAGLGLLHWHWRVRPGQQAWLAPLVGLATGLVTAATGVFVIPAVPYLQALDLDKETLVRALGLSFLAATIALALALGNTGALDAAVLSGSALSLLPALVGMGLGQHLRMRVHPEAFKRVFFGGLLALGAYLALRSVLPML
jgi:uncharacterized membrane protein YfcA